MGDYLRYKSALGPLSELVILMTAREWSQDYECSDRAESRAPKGPRADAVVKASAQLQ
jgi:hypothetical protein